MSHPDAQHPAPFNFCLDLNQEATAGKRECVTDTFRGVHSAEPISSRFSNFFCLFQTRGECLKDTSPDLLHYALRLSHTDTFVNNLIVC